MDTIDEHTNLDSGDMLSQEAKDADSSHGTRNNRITIAIGAAAGAAVLAGAGFLAFAKGESETATIPQEQNPVTATSMGVDSQPNETTIAIQEFEPIKVGEITLSGKSTELEPVYALIDFSTKETTIATAPEPMLATSNDAQEILDTIMFNTAMANLTEKGEYQAAQIIEYPALNMNEAVQATKDKRAELATGAEGPRLMDIYWGTVNKVEQVSDDVYRLHTTESLWRETNSLEVRYIINFTYDIKHDGNSWKRSAESEADNGYELTVVHKTENIIGANENPFAGNEFIDN